MRLTLLTFIILSVVAHMHALPRPFWRARIATQTPPPTLIATLTVVPTGKPTLTPTVTSTSTATLIPTVVPTQTTAATVTPARPTPTFTMAPAPISISASVSDSRPHHNEIVTVYGTIMAGSQDIAGAQMGTTWHYKTTTAGCSGVSNASGTASCSRDISTATSGYTVVIDVVFTYQGQTYFTSTSFTPQ